MTDEEFKSAQGAFEKKIAAPRPSYDAIAATKIPDIPNSNQPEFWAKKAVTELKATEGQLNVYLDKERIKRIKIYSVINEIPIKELVSSALQEKYNL